MWETRQRRDDDGMKIDVRGGSPQRKIRGARGWMEDTSIWRDVGPRCTISRQRLGVAGTGTRSGVGKTS